MVDRADRLLGLVERIQRRVDRDQVRRADQLLAVLDALRDRLPVARLLGQAGQVPRDPGPRLLGRAGGLQEGPLAGGFVARGEDKRGQHRAAGLEEVAVEVADQDVAAPARPDVRVGDAGEDAHGHVLAFGIVEGEPRGGHGERAARRDALLVERITGRPAPERRPDAAVVGTPGVGCGELGRQGEQRIGLQPARLGPGRGERALERPAERAERGLRRRAGRAREAGGDEDPVVGERVGRAAGMEPAPAGRAQERAAALADPRLDAARSGTGRRPGVEGGPEAGTRPVQDLEGAALGGGVGQGAGERARDLLVEVDERRKFEDEPDARGVHVEPAPLVPGPPREELVERRRHRRRGPGGRRLRTLEELQQAADHGSFQPAGSSTTRTQWASR